MNNLIFISSEHPSFDSLNATYQNGIYFDGLTQDFFNYDCCGLIKGTISPGIVDCTIHDYPNPCKAFIWEYKQSHLFWRGFVVDAKDPAALKKAQKAYRTKTNTLIKI